MKRISISVLVMLLLISASRGHGTFMRTPEVTVRSFYAWYLHRLILEDHEPLKHRTEALKYLTPEFLRRVPRLTREMDADVIICAQDWDRGWEKNFQVDTATVNGASASTVVELKGNEMATVKVKVTLKRAASGWRIDGTKCVD